MASAHCLSVREEVIRLRELGHSMIEISELLPVCYGSVRDFCKRYSTCAEKGDKSVLLPHYNLCGPQEKEYSLPVIEASLALKRLHPRWGAPRLLVSLEAEMATQGIDNPEDLPCIRTLERWYREHNLIKPKRQPCEPTIGRARAVHNIWEVDAKEQLELLDGQAACYLTMVDEKSGAWLASPVFPL